MRHRFTGTTTLDDINAELTKRAALRGAEVTAVQSNVEGEIVTHIQDAALRHDAIVYQSGRVYAYERSNSRCD